VGGCGSYAKLDLVQPQLVGPQSHVQLRSERVFWSPADGVERLLVEFPPPGASTGLPRMYLLYLRWPVGQQSPAVGQGGQAAAKGFLIQTRGRLAGLALIVGGQLTVQGTSDAPKARRRLTFDLLCEDGSRLMGRVDAQRDDGMLREFETRRRPVDVDKLTAASPTTASSAAP